jgi:hypothetical protein
MKALKYIVLHNEIPAKIDLYYTNALNKYIRKEAKLDCIKSLKRLGYKVSYGSYVIPSITSKLLK